MSPDPAPWIDEARASPGPRGADEIMKLIIAPALQAPVTKEYLK